MCHVFARDLVLLCVRVRCYVMSFLLFRFRVVVFVFFWKLKKKKINHNLNKKETHPQEANQHKKQNEQSNAFDVVFILYGLFLFYSSLSNVLVVLSSWFAC